MPCVGQLIPFADGVRFLPSQGFGSGILSGRGWGPIVRMGIWGGTERVWAFREEERIADIAVANDAGSFDDDDFLRSMLAEGWEVYFLI